MNRLIPLGLLLVGLAQLLPVSAQSASASKFIAYFGTYSGGKSKGIYMAEFDAATGQFGTPEVAAETTNPSFLAIHPTSKYLYAVGEIADFDKKTRSGAIVAFSIGEKGTLKLLNSASSEGGGPCHLVVDKAGKFVLAANYGGGSACVLPLDNEGKLSKATGFVQHKGSSVNKSRQSEPHAHSINLDAANNFAFVADLGLDKVLIYKFDKETGKITSNDPPAGVVKDGAGPRHFAFHPSGKYAYVCNELDSTVTAFAYDAAAGKLTEIHTLSTLEKPHKGNSTAEVVVHPNGKFVYVSNRGHDTIACYRCDAATGALTFI
ncbi:MAG: lactonase family protein, partial [Planctomycetia bacterium]|nr:lactonase family protein [Planctomycetia bacterium]